MFELNLTEFLVQDKIGREDIVSWASWAPELHSSEELQGVCEALETTCKFWSVFF